MRDRSEVPRRTLDPVDGRTLEEYWLCVLPLSEERVIPRGAVTTGQLPSMASRDRE